MAIRMDTELFHRQGYLSGLRLFSPEQCPRLLELYWRLRSLLPPGMSTQKMDWWHGEDRELWEVCTNPRLLDAVEAILGPDFYLWGSQFFSKEPGDGKTAPWHQDAFYWPLSPHRSVTAWLAFTDSDEENGCMRVIPGSHRAGRLRHRKSGSDTDVLDMELAPEAFRATDAVPLCLKAGEISLHDDNIVHGSGPNRSDRLRCGLTIRFSAGEVRGDTSVWPFFKAFWVRGTDRWQHNPVGAPPAGEMTRCIQITG
jgi:non-heme Fe2+,alpha-ketoglutarate-dependent halogenase